MKKITAMFVLTIYFTGCLTLGIKMHQIFIKDGTPQVETISQVMDKLGYDDSYYLDIKSSRDDKKNISVGFNTTYSYNDKSISNLTNDSKVVVQYFNAKGHPCGDIDHIAPTIVGQCSQNIPTTKNMYSYTYFEALVINKKLKSSFAKKNTAVILIPSKLKSKNLLDEHNLSKGDICIYPLGNISCENLKKGDWFTISREEIDKALTKFYDE